MKNHEYATGLIIANAREEFDWIYLEQVTENIVEYVFEYNNKLHYQNYALSSFINDADVQVTNIFI